jgi:GT2 family glycosyltransferase
MSLSLSSPLTTRVRALALMEDARLRADGPHLWHHVPGPRGLGPLDSDLIVTGAAVARSGVESVWVRVDGGPPVQARHGYPNPTVRDAFSDEHGPGSGDWAIVLDTSSWPKGTHSVQALAVTNAGGSELVARTVHVNRDAAYRRMLGERSEVSRTKGDPGEARFAVLLLGHGELGEDAVGQLTAQTHTAWRVARVGDQATGRRSNELGSLPAERRLGGGHLSDLDDALEALERHKVTHAALARQGDQLDPHALQALANVASADIAYTDEDRICSDGQRGCPVFKPLWSPELLLAQDYIGPFFSIRTERLRQARERGGPLRCSYDILIRLIDDDLTVAHVRELLYTRVEGDPPDLDSRERESVLALADRRGEKLAVARGPRQGTRRLRWTLPSRPLVSIVIPTTGDPNLLTPCLRSLAQRTAYAPIEVVLVDTRDGEWAIDMSPLGDIACRVVPCAQPFNFSLACNIGSLGSRGEILLYMNDDVEPLEADWLERMLELLLQPGVGIVGAKLLYPEGLVQHAGVFFADTIGPTPTGRFATRTAHGENGHLALPRNCAAVTGACLMISRTTHDLLGGFDERIAIEYGDVDLCLRARALGRRVAWTPDAVLLHHESVTRRDTPHPRDKSLFTTRWPEAMRGEEPYQPRLPNV